jgi:hypothetical protein
LRAVNSADLKRLAQIPQQGRGAVAVLDPAAVTMTVSSSPTVSTVMCRLRPSTFLPAS